MAVLMDLEITLFVTVPRKSFGADLTTGKINHRKYCRNVMTRMFHPDKQKNEWHILHSYGMFFKVLTKFLLVTTDSFSLTRGPTSSLLKTQLGHSPRILDSS